MIVPAAWVDAGGYMIVGRLSYVLCRGGYTYIGQYTCLFYGRPTAPPASRRPPWLFLGRGGYEGAGGAPAHRRLFTAGELQQGAPSAMTAAPLAAPPPPLKTELEILHEAGDQKFGRSRRSRWQRREQQQAPPHALQAPPASPPRAARSSLSLGFGTPPAPGRGGAAPAPALAAGQRRSRDAEPRTKPPPATRPAPFATFDAAAALHKPPVQSLRNFSAARATAVGAAPPRAPVRSLRDFHKDDATGGGHAQGARQPLHLSLENLGGATSSAWAPPDMRELF